MTDGGAPFRGLAHFCTAATEAALPFAVFEGFGIPPFAKERKGWATRPKNSPTQINTRKLGECRCIFPLWTCLQV
jgi:hypothetical protein